MTKHNTKKCIHTIRYLGGCLPHGNSEIQALFISIPWFSEKALRVLQWIFYIQSCAKKIKIIWEIFQRSSWNAVYYFWFHWWEVVRYYHLETKAQKMQLERKFQQRNYRKTDKYLGNLCHNRLNSMTSVCPSKCFSSRVFPYVVVVITFTSQNVSRAGTFTLFLMMTQFLSL